MASTSYKNSRKKFRYYEVFVFFGAAVLISVYQNCSPTQGQIAHAASNQVESLSHSEIYRAVSSEGKNLKAL